MELFTPEQLQGLLGVAVTEDRARAIEEVVWGWLQPALGVDDRPSPVPPQVFSWAIELAAIAHENPAGLSSKQVGAVQEQYSEERRAEILAQARQSSSGSDAGKPQGSFPSARPYPDPADWCW